MKKHNKIAEGFKNFKEKLPKVFKKDGVLLSLFIILCAVTIVGTVAIKKSKITEQVKKNPNTELTLNVDDKNKDEQKETMDNSQRVENEEKGNTKEDKKEAKAASAKVKNEFVAPVMGKVVRDFKSPLKDGAGRRILPGVTIASEKGTDIKSAEAGVIEECRDDAFYGTTVTVKHANGVKTVYSNLDKKLSVKKGDKVTKGQVIGKVGATAKGLDILLEENKIKDSFCNIEMTETKDNKTKSVDPTKFLEFK
ncbi:MAG: peptidoglycan DD-metalloendopeptidase family protein [Clostridium sp.]|uniref:M23 family metallopeptidase n=1 Tax=Clostridium chrysemydis TaxID=2665504 RepID=UPI0018833110|nr:M23 family metallopeptidase [Clostridium chrysemydis]